MPFLSRLRIATKTTHHQVGEMPFLQRYQSNKLNLISHYLHLCQLLPIYKILESKLKQSTYADKFPDDLRYLLSRSERLQADINCLEQYVPAQMRNWQSVAVDKYVHDLTACENADTIFGHFLARILGDMFGGQRIAEKLGNLNAEFYAFPDGALKDTLKWLEKIVDENNSPIIIDAANDGIKRHIPIFADLEKQMLAQEKANNKSRLFAPANIAAAVAVIAGIGFATRTLM